jgi:formylglycine-generating enzyme required for sulfatase activity/predicted Ser/Thr protein kinase
MPLSDCPGREKLCAFVLGDLPEGELGAVAGHLDRCRRCEEQVGQLDGLSDAVLGDLRRVAEAPHGTNGDTSGAGGSGHPAALIASRREWGDFRIIREIGRGGMGIVYEAYQGSLNRHVALKFLPEHGDVARFRREARAAGRLHHTNIVPVFGVGQHEGRHYYIMQYIDGRGLDTVFKERAAAADTGGSPGPFDPLEAARIGVQAAEALAYAHAQGVVHRDIKPSNVVVDAAGTVWITDFGLAYGATSTETLTHTGDFLGTLRYVAPERFSGQGDHRADIYGLGSTLYELICGKPAFAEADRAALLNRIMHEEPGRPCQLDRSIPRDLETVVLKAMACDPAHRYATAAAMAEDLRRFLEDRPILARRTGVHERLARWCRRNPVVAGLQAAVFLLLAMVAVMAWGEVRAAGRLRAAALVESIRTAAIAEVPPLIRQFDGYRPWTDPQLRRILSDSDPKSRAHLHASPALLDVDPSQTGFLGERLLTASPGELPVIREALRPHGARLRATLWPVLEGAQPGDDRLLRSAAALALYDPEEPRWAGVADRVVQALVTENALFLGIRLEALRPVSDKLTRPLSAIFRDAGRSETVHSLATDILTDYAADDPGLLAGLLMDADPKAYTSLVRVAERRPDRTLPLFRAELARWPEPGWSEAAKDELAQRQARAAIASIRMGAGDDAWTLLRHGPDPRLRSYLINWLEPLGVGARLIAAELDRRDSAATRNAPPAARTMDAIFYEPETSVRRALILALGTYRPEALSQDERERWIARLVARYESDPDAGIHGAAQWALRRWGQSPRLRAVESGLRCKRRGDRRWFVNSQGQKLAVVEGPFEFRMGSPPDEPGRDPDEPAHRRLIPRRFAIATKEVTVEQYQEFLKQNPKVERLPVSQYSPDPAGPMNRMTWYEAAAYCNWLSRLEGLPECYDRNPSGQFAAGMRLRPETLARGGYRLPTEAEWEYACRAGARTSRPYGLSTKLLPNYAWYQANSDDRAWPVGSLLPNNLGLFDILGNLTEWCHDEYRDDPPGPAGAPAITGDISVTLDDRLSMVSRGLAFNKFSAGMRSASRTSDAPWSRSLDYGFRPARTLP